MCLFLFVYLIHLRIRSVFSIGYVSSVIEPSVMIALPIRPLLSVWLLVQLVLLLLLVVVLLLLLLLLILLLLLLNLSVLFMFGLMGVSGRVVAVDSLDELLLALDVVVVDIWFGEI